MSSHVAPHRWADLLQGKLDDAERAVLERHAAECPKCARDRKRIARASDTFPQIRTQQPPELGWDGVRARVHWSVSTAKHERVRDPRRGWLKPLAIGFGGAAVLAGGIVATVAVMHRHHDAPVAVAPPAPAAVRAAAQHGLVSRIAGDVLIDGVRPAHPFDISLGKGTVVATGAGRVDIQFGEASGFALGPRSTLELRAFDAETIELAVEGSIELVVAPRVKGQRFLVVAGDHTVEVRGTRFSVVHDATGTSVSCQHGLVAVHDVHAANGELEVGAARKAFVASGHPLAEARAVPLTAEELGMLAKSAPFTLPTWTADLAAHSAPLEIATPGTRDVRVDGIEVGAGPLAMRVLPGRHTIETADPAGRFRRAGWVDAAVGNAAHFEALPISDDIAPPTSGIATRKLQLKTGIDRERLRACTRRLAKSGLTDTYVQIEIAVDANGAVNVLNIVDTDLPSDTASCVHDVLADVRFAAGPAATWREKLGL